MNGISGHSLSSMTTLDTDRTTRAWLCQSIFVWCSQSSDFNGIKNLQQHLNWCTIYWFTNARAEIILLCWMDHQSW